MEVQRLRHRCMGIMVGIGTVLADDPMLNVRLSEGNSPVRIICDSHLRIPLDSQICQTAKQYPTVVAYVPERESCIKASCQEVHRQEKVCKLEQLGVRTLPVSDRNGQVDLRKLMGSLHRRFSGEMKRELRLRGWVWSFPQKRFRWNFRRRSRLGRIY